MTDLLARCGRRLWTSGATTGAVATMHYCAKADDGHRVHRCTCGHEWERG